jgi:hypothetical protein
VFITSNGQTGQVAYHFVEEIVPMGFSLIADRLVLLRLSKTISSAILQDLYSVQGAEEGQLLGSDLIASF